MVRIVLVVLSHHSSCLGVSSSSTFTVFPAGMRTRLKARSVLIGPSVSPFIAMAGIILISFNGTRLHLNPKGDLLAVAAAGIGDGYGDFCRFAYLDR